MPRETVWMLRAALVHLVIGFALGAMLLVAKEWPIGPWTGAWLAVHRDVVLIGWMVQLVLGVAYWILPKYPREPIRGPRWPAVAGVLLLNGGLMVGPLARWLDAPAIGYVVIASGALLLVAVLIPRAKSFGAGRASAGAA
jgi:hypothetical protein